ncbi:DMT family transporter [Gemmobacter serpentinus]|uniref:DMT family transporter n=1 Tax=Gemmobacter serpentinus TaxID=2652247 RepID=UPI00124CC650|nr:DMT family transporter [Gemmobacter serpentinus]
MQEQRPFLAAIWMSGSILSFTAMAVAGRAVAGTHDTFEIMFWRSVTGFVLVVVVAAAMGRLGQVQTARLPQHLLRNIIHFSGQNLWFWALTAIPLAQVFALEFTSPIWVILLSPLLLGERLTGVKVLAAAMGFAGAMIVARPDMQHLEPGVLAAAASAICFAGSIIMTKRLTRAESLVSILFWLTLMQAGLGLIASGWDGQIALPTAATLPWLVLIGAAGVIAHLCLTMALSLAPASVVVPIDFARLPIIALVAMALYGERLDLAVLIGGAIIFAANWINIRAQTRPA